jgi:hypothetical protein
MIGIIGLMFGGGSATYGAFSQTYWVFAAGVLLSIVSGISISKMLKPIE